MWGLEEVVVMVRRNAVEVEVRKVRPFVLVWVLSTSICFRNLQNKTIIETFFDTNWAS